MTRTAALRNPILRRKANVSIDAPVVNLGTELKEQELDRRVGAGNIIDEVTTVFTPTPNHGCGMVLTISLECSGRRC